MIDIESILLKIKDLLVANLNTYITAMNSEKGDSLLGAVDDNAYFLQTFNDTVANYNPHVLVSVDNIESAGIGPGVVKKLTFSVVMIMSDSGQDMLFGQRLLRYGRVLEDLFNASFNKILPSVKIEINSLVPIALTSVNSNDPFRAVGIQVVTALG